MPNEVVVGLLSLMGTLATVFMGNRLVIFRIEQLEKKVEKHNNLVERMAVVEQDVKSAHHRIDEVQKEMEA